MDKTCYPFYYVNEKEKPNLISQYDIILNKN